MRPDDDNDEIDPPVTNGAGAAGDGGPGGGDAPPDDFALPSTDGLTLDFADKVAPGAAGEPEVPEKTEKPDNPDEPEKPATPAPAPVYCPVCGGEYPPLAEGGDDARLCPDCGAVHFCCPDCGRQYGVSEITARREPRCDCGRLFRLPPAPPPPTPAPWAAPAPMPKPAPQPAPKAPHPVPRPAPRPGPWAPAKPAPKPKPAPWAPPWPAPGRTGDHRRGGRGGRRPRPPRPFPWHDLDRPTPPPKRRPATPGQALAGLGTVILLEVLASIESETGVKVVFLLLFAAVSVGIYFAVRKFWRG